MVTITTCLFTQSTQNFDLIASLAWQQARSQFCCLQCAQDWVLFSVPLAQICGFCHQRVFPSNHRAWFLMDKINEPKNGPWQENSRNLAAFYLTMNNHWRD